MPVPSTVADLSSTASSNYPSGSESIGTSLDDYLRAHASIIKQVSDAKADTSHTHIASNISDSTIAGRAILTAADASAQRTALGLVPGTSANNIVQLDGSAKLPSVDGSQLTGINSKQIQSISASVSGNALTISSSALTLDFRSTTLGSGTVTTVSGTPANLVISSGSTLGTINATQSRIVVLAINNAGTIELAAVNIAGGNQLDETNLISTTAEGGAGAADSANVIYSTTARTNVAYRVIGYVEFTQATAGTWATAPSTIQGAGGNAITTMSSLGYWQTWQDVTGSRVSGTTYYNTTGKPIQVVLNRVGINPGSPISLTISGVALIKSGVVVGTYTAYETVQGIVPPGASYVGSFAATMSWYELR